MEYKVFTVFDSKAAAYLQPFFTATTGLAIRSFQDAALNPEHQFNKHLGDYTLFEIGTYDDLTGKFVQSESFHNLGTALSYASKEKV